MSRPVSFGLSFLLRHVLAVFCISIPARIWTVVDTRTCINPNHHVGVAGSNTTMIGANVRLTVTHVGVIRSLLAPLVDGTRVYIATH